MTEDVGQPLPRPESDGPHRGREVFIFITGVIIIVLSLASKSLFWIIGAGMVVGSSWRWYRGRRVRGGAA